MKSYLSLFFLILYSNLIFSTQTEIKVITHKIPKFSDADKHPEQKIFFLLGHLDLKDTIFQFLDDITLVEFTMKCKTWKEIKINFQLLKENNEIQNDKTFITETFTTMSGGVIIKTFQFFNFRIDLIISVDNKIVQIKRKSNSEPNQNLNLKQMKIENYCLLKLFKNSDLEIITLEPEKLQDADWHVVFEDFQNIPRGKHQDSEIITNIQNIPRGKHNVYDGKGFIFIQQDCKSLVFCFLKSSKQKFFVTDLPIHRLLLTPDHVNTTIEKIFSYENLVLLWTNRQTLIAHRLSSRGHLGLKLLSWYLPFEHNVIDHEISIIDGVKIIDFDEKNKMITLENQTNLYLRITTNIPSDKHRARACMIGYEYNDDRRASMVAYFEKYKKSDFHKKMKIKQKLFKQKKK